MTQVNKTTTTESPSPLMGEESKVRVNKSKPTNTLARHCGLDPQSRGAVDLPVILALRQYDGAGRSFPRRRESTGRGRAPWSVIADLIRNPQGGVTAR